jgi:hypothetical protein
MPGRDLILTTLHRMRYESIAPFILSLKKTGYGGQIVAFVGDMDKKSLAQMREQEVNIVRFRFIGRHVYQPLSRPWGLLRRLFASHLPVAAKERLAHMVFHLFYRRHLLYLQYLRAHQQEYDRVLVTDCRDVYFQADPFSWNPEPGVHFFLEETANKIGTCPHHIRWISSQFDRAVLDELQHETVSCAGTTLGDTASMIEYLSAMVSYTMKALSLRECDGDQGIHNYIAIKQMLHSRIIVHSNRASPILTGAPAGEDFRLGSQGLLVNNAGQVVPVLHQYDRDLELKRHLLERLELTNPV